MPRRGNRGARERGRRLAFWETGFRGGAGAGAEAGPKPERRRAPEGSAVESFWKDLETGMFVSNRVVREGVRQPSCKIDEAVRSENLKLWSTALIKARKMAGTPDPEELGVSLLLVEQLVIQELVAIKWWEQQQQGYNDFGGLLSMITHPFNQNHGHLGEYGLLAILGLVDPKNGHLEHFLDTRRKTVDSDLRGDVTYTPPGETKEITIDVKTLANPAAEIFRVREHKKSNPPDFYVVMMCTGIESSGPVLQNLNTPSVRVYVYGHIPAEDAFKYPIKGGSHIIPLKDLTVGLPA